MKVNIEDSWKGHLQQEFEKPYFKTLAYFVRDAYQQQCIYPPAKEVFHAFDLCSFEATKVVILGQDPYHGQGQAHGLCFSVRKGVAPPPSLRNIFKEIHNDLGVPIPTHGSLEHWARQGVLLLNTTLTVEAHKPGSHQNQGWQTFTDAVISEISNNKTNVVFLLWGAHAQKKQSLIDANRHLILTSPHPSPYSADRGFFGNKHFSKTNNYLKTHQLAPIDWVL